MAGTAALREALLSRTMLLDVTDDNALSRACLVDWRVSRQSASTLVSFDARSTSFYGIFLSSGGGIIGAGSMPSAQPAAANFWANFKSLESHFWPAHPWCPLGLGILCFMWLIVSRRERQRIFQAVNFVQLTCASNYRINGAEGLRGCL